MTNKAYLIRNVLVVDENGVAAKDVLMQDEIIEKIDNSINSAPSAIEVNGEGLHLFPGLIEDQVHFREPGLTHKGDIYSESRAALAGGITSYMEMPNTVPAALSMDLLEQKFDIASRNSAANYSFYLGAGTNNLDELIRVPKQTVAGIKIFMGSSTGNLLVDDEQILDSIFANVDTLIATHCETDKLIAENAVRYRNEYGDNATAEIHHLVRDAQSCYASSSLAVSLAKKHNSRLHILHISTARELELFSPGDDVNNKRITAEACVHHLWFSNEDYKTKGNFIKWNPAIKTVADRSAIRIAVNEGRIDVIATDHAPHTIEEKSKRYFDAPSGGPLVQHSLMALISLHHQGIFTLETIARKSAHNVARMFKIEKRGFIREGYYADAVLVDINASQTITKDGLLYKCGWSPFEGDTLRGKVLKTWVNGHLAYNEGKIDDSIRGKRLIFNR